MPIVNDQLSGIFGPVTSFFIDTSPRKFLFEGMEFCKSPTGLPEIICNSVLERQSPSITKSQDGTSLVFSMFAHVTLAIISSCGNIFMRNSLHCRKIERTMDSTRSTLEFVGWTDCCRSRDGTARERFTIGMPTRTALLPFVSSSMELMQRLREHSEKRTTTFTSSPVTFAGKAQNQKLLVSFLNQIFTQIRPTEVGQTHELSRNRCIPIFHTRKLPQRRRRVLLHKCHSQRIKG